MNVRLYPLLLLFILFLENGLFAQVRVRIYYNQDWQITRENGAVFYREADYDTLRRYFEGSVKDFTRNGHLFAEGHYHLGEKDGMFKFYFADGKTVKSEGRYDRNYRTGNWKFYYPNGQVNQVLKFDHGDFSVVDFYNEKGAHKVENGNGQWELEVDAGLEKPLLLEGGFENGKKTGVWYYRFKKGSTIAAEQFEDGRFRFGEKYYADSVQHYHQSLFGANIFEPAYFDKVESFEADATVDQTDYPFFKFLPEDNSINRFYAYIQRHLRYPVEARKNKIEGRVVVSFEVHADGSVSNVKIIQGLEGGCDEAVVQVIESLPADIFHITHDKETKTLPITFRLG